MNYGNGMHVDTGIKFSMNFSHGTIYWDNSSNFIGTSIGMPVYSGNKLFRKFGHSKFGHTENSQENAGSILLK